MYGVSEKYKEAVYGGIIESYVAGALTLADGAEIALEKGTFETISINNKCVDSESLEFGQVYTGELCGELAIDIDRYKMYGAEIKCSYFIRTGETFEKIPLGVFYVSEATRETKTGPLRITAYDDMQTFKEKYDGSIKTGTPFELLSFICEKIGVPLETKKEEIDAMANGSVLFGVSPEYGWETWLDIVSDICEILAGFGYIGRNGGLVIKQFATNPAEYITKNQRQNYGTVADYVCHFSMLSISKTDGVITAGGDGDGLTMEITDNRFFSTGTDAQLQLICDNIWAVLQNITYTPATVELYDDPSFDLGDRLALSGFAFEENTEILIFSYNWSHRGGNNIECSGENPMLGNKPKSETEKKLEVLTQTIEADKTTFQYFKNGDAISVAQLQKILSLYYALGSESAIAALHGQVCLYVTMAEGVEEGLLKLHYFVNAEEDTEIVPAVSVFKTGFYLLPLYYTAGGAVGKANDLSVYIECENCAAVINPYGLHGSLSGQGIKTVVQEWDGTISVDVQCAKIVPESFEQIKIKGFDVSAGGSSPALVQRSLSVEISRIDVTGDSVAIRPFTVTVKTEDPYV